MARRVFFSYHFDRDVWRANQVRQSWVTKPDRAAAGFFDAAEQEEVKRASDTAIRQWIDDQLRYTSVTAVLIGEETASRKYVQYEIEKSFARGNALLGIHIHSVKNRDGETAVQGRNPLKDFYIDIDAGRNRLSDLFPTYDWSWDNGQENMGEWIAEAAQVNEEIPREWRDNLVAADASDEGTLLDGIVRGAAIGGGILLGLKFVEELRRDRRRDRFDRRFR